MLVAAPAILRDWHLPQNAMGLVFGAGNLGLLVGAVVFGKVGDRYGRRIGIIASVLTYIRREWEHNASPVAPDEVAKIRSQFELTPVLQALGGRGQ